mmetsp:Transcript_43651/g.102638  ORF Transcript_43651/g.102638 Transcript_43651/m.102638 type:complete len:276 (-) Transcript_43651:112-939(-)|eukprot:476866-Rhodomonas_salina.1
MKPRQHRSKELNCPSVVVFISKRTRKLGLKDHEILDAADEDIECIAKRRGKRPPSLNPDVVFTAKPIAPRIRRCRESELEQQRFLNSPMSRGFGDGGQGKPSPTAVFHPFVLDFGNKLIDGFIAQSPHHHDDEMGQAGGDATRDVDGEANFAPIWSLHISLNQLQKGHNGATFCRSPSESHSKLQPTALGEWKSILNMSKKTEDVAGDKSLVSLQKSAKIQEVCSEGDDLSDLQDLFQQNMHVVKVETDDLSDLRECFAQHLRFNQNSQLACRFG